MKKHFSALLALFVAVGLSAQTSETVTLQGKDYLLVKHLERSIGPGTVYTRYRLPDFPLNVNIVTVDLNNPHVKIETTIPNDRAYGTELLVDAAKRYDAPGHRPMAAENSNFFIVASQPPYKAYGPMAHGVSLREGIFATDSKCLPHWWWWTTEHAGIVSVDVTNKLYIDVCKATQTFTTEKLGTREFTNANKGFKSGQYSIYTPYYGPDRQFIPLRDDTPEEISQNNLNYDIVEDEACTEVMLTLDEGSEWTAGRDVCFTVAEVRSSNGRGTLGSYDLAIVAKGDELAQLVKGDKVTLNYSWVFNTYGKEETPEIRNAVTGNMFVMRDGEITEQNYWDSYNTMVYSRAAYGSSKDGKKLYMVVIDKSQDPVYKMSAGCTVAEMCDLMRHLGCNNLLNVDAGGSAELMIEDRIINRTTEGTPRAVANGWMIFNTAPEDDNEVASLAFEDVTLDIPTGATFVPQVIAYNKYGTVLNYDYKDFVTTCSDGIGTCDGSAFVAGSEMAEGTLTVTAPTGATVSKAVSVKESEPVMTRSFILIDEGHAFPIEVTTTLGDKTYSFDPAHLSWSIADPTVVSIDEEGVLHALRNGSTTITGTLRETTITAEVTVENPTASFLLLNADWNKWTVKGSSGLKSVTLGNDGNITYTYNNPRSASEITLSADLSVYGLPEKLEVEFTHDLPVDKLTLDLRPAGAERTYATIEPEQAWTAGETHIVEVPVSMVGEPSYAGTYPLTLRSIKFSSPVSSEYKGDHILSVKAIRAVYPSTGSIALPNAGANSDAPVEYFNLQGMRVLNPTTGIYIRRQGTDVRKVVLQ